MMRCCLLSAFICFSGWASTASAVINTPCHSCAPEFATDILNELSDRPVDEPLDGQSLWLRERLSDVDGDRLLAVQAAIAGYCVRECSQSFATARVVVDALVEDQKRSAEALVAEQERRTEEKVRRDDRLMSIISAIVGAIVATLGVVLVNAIQTRRQRRTER